VLSGKLGFRLADGISERVIFREFFPLGLTACDTFDRELLGAEPTMSHLAARQEVRDLIRFLGFGERRTAHPAAPAIAGPALQAAASTGEPVYS
jgi:chromosome partitioning protein